MRPDEWRRVNAYRWYEAVSIVNAYREGFDGAADEKKAHDEALAMAPVA